MNQTENVPFHAGISFLVIGLIGNLLVIRIVHKMREMHTPTNYLLVSMAVSDVVTILLWPVYYFEFSKVVCKFVALAEVSIVVSYNTLTVLAVERYHAILKPFATGLRLNHLYLDRRFRYTFSGILSKRMERDKLHMHRSLDRTDE